MPLPSISLQRLNVMKPLVEWFFDPQVTSAKKVAACALGVIAFLGTSYKIGYIAAVGFVGIPLFVWGAYEVGALYHPKEEWSVDRESMLALHGTLRGARPLFENLAPKAQEQRYPPNWETLLIWDELTQPMTQGMAEIKKEQVPFIALKVKDTKKPKEGIFAKPFEGEHIIIAYLGSQKETWGYRLLSQGEPQALQSGVRNLIESLQNGTHPQFELVK